MPANARKRPPWPAVARTTFPAERQRLLPGLRGRARARLRA